MKAMTMMKARPYQVSVERKVDDQRTLSMATARKVTNQTVMVESMQMNICVLI